MRTHNAFFFFTWINPRHRGNGYVHDANFEPFCKFHTMARTVSAALKIRRKRERIERMHELYMRQLAHREIMRELLRYFYIKEIYNALY